MNKIRCIAFDCFGTLFDVSTLPDGHVAKYVEHVRRRQFVPYVFPLQWWELTAHDDVASGFHELRKGGFILVALSNGDPDLIEHLSKSNGFAFHHVIDLRKHFVYKPGLAAYRIVHAECGYWPNETILVTANPTFGDVYGAFVTGMMPVLLRQPGWPQTVVELAEWMEARES